MSRHILKAVKFVANDHRSYSVSSKDVHKHLKAMAKQVTSGKGSISRQIHETNEFLATGNLLPANQCVLLMQACTRDIIDIHIQEQKILTYSCWRNIERLKLKDDPTRLHNSALEAFLFQEIDFHEELFTSACDPDEKTYESLIRFHCMKGDLNRAMHLAQTHNVWTEKAVFTLMTANIRAARDRTAMEILERLDLDEAQLSRPLEDKSNLSIRLRAAGAFLIGAACSGDVDRVKYYLRKYPQGLKEMLIALVALCRKSPGDYTQIYDAIKTGITKDGHIIHLSKMARRPVKLLLDLDLHHVALDLVCITREHSPDTKTKYISMISRTPVMLLDWYLEQDHHQPPTVDQVWNILTRLEACDSSIKAKAVSLLYKLALERPDLKPLCRELIRRIEALFGGSLHSKTPALHLLMKYIVYETHHCVTDTQLVNLLVTASELGIRWTNHNPVWDNLLRRLIPTTPQSEEYTTYSLLDRVRAVRYLLEAVESAEVDYYSNSVIWGHLMRSLLARETETFFLTAAKLTEKLGVVYAPSRWYQHLGETLCVTRLSMPYLTILEVCHRWVDKRAGDGPKNFNFVCESLLVAIKRSESEANNMDAQLGEIFQFAFSRGILFPPRVKEKVCEHLTCVETLHLINSIPAQDVKDNRIAANEADR